MKALISKKSITEYQFSEQIAGRYIHALQALHSGDEIDDFTSKVLHKAKLYSLSTKQLRVFNYKRPKNKAQDYLLSQEIKFLIPGFDSIESPLWYKPRFKFHREALDLLINKYGFRKACYLVYVMIPSAKGVEFVSQISNPTELLSKLAKFSHQYQKEEISKNNKLLVNKLTEELEKKLKNYGIH